jgi:glycosyltransferase involved in cell wall biosynthesis
MQRVRLPSRVIMNDAVIEPDGAPMRIVFLIGALDVGGTERQLLELASRLDRKRFEPVIYCLTAPGALAEEACRRGIEVRSSGLRGLRPWRNPFRLTRRTLKMYADLKSLNADVLHAFLFHAYTVGALLSPLLRPKAFVSSRRSLGHFKANHRGALMLERVGNRFTDIFIANSEAVRQDAIAQEGLEPARVIVIHNGVEVATAATDAAAVKRELNVPPGCTLVAVVANFIAYKGHECFLNAWRRIQDTAPGAVALLIGEGPTRPRMERLAAELRLTSTLRFLGNRSDVGAILSAVDVVVHPSEQEGFSNAILEAMAAGRPVIATAVGGNVEALADGETGLLVRPNDPHMLAEAIERLLGSPTERRRLGLAGRQRAERSFGIDRMTHAYENVYSALINTNVPRVTVSQVSA